jgi:hypothetical protein
MASGAPRRSIAFLLPPGPSPLWAWQLLWVNLVFNWPAARWYVLEMGRGEWTATELRAALQATVPRLAVRTVSNAILELVGLLERTPIGGELGQGEVRPGRPRRVRREGLPGPATSAMLYAAQRLFLSIGRPQRATALALDGIRLPTPGRAPAARREWRSLATTRRRGNVL